MNVGDFPYNPKANRFVGVMPFTRITRIKYKASTRGLGARKQGCEIDVNTARLILIRNCYQ